MPDLVKLWYHESMRELRDLLHITGSSKPFEDSRQALRELGTEDPAVIHPTDGQQASDAFKNIAPLGGQHVGETLPPITTTTPEGKALAEQLEVLSQKPRSPSETFSWYGLLKRKQAQKGVKNAA